MQSNTYGWLASALILACAAGQNHYHPNDSGLISPESLDGQWCASGPNTDLCLTAKGGSYVWKSSDCFEVGNIMTGMILAPRGYNPDGTPLCFAVAADEQGPLPYAIDARWTDTGLHVETWSNGASFDLEGK